MSAGADDTADAVTEAKKMLEHQDRVKKLLGRSYEPLDNQGLVIALLAHIDDLEAKNVAVCKAIWKIQRVSRLTYSHTPEGMSAAMGGEWVYRHGADGLDAALKDALEIAQIKERS